MIKPRIPYEELSALVDNEVSGPRAEELRRLVASDTEAYELVQFCQLQKLALRARYDAKLSEPVPARLLAAFERRSAADEPASFFARLQQLLGLSWQAGALQLAPRAVASFCALFISAGAGALVAYQELSRQPLHAELRAFSQQATVAHAVFTPEARHPVEVTADDGAHLKAWLSTRLGRTVALPDLSADGYRLIGGRLLPGKAGTPAAQLMYEDQHGKRLTLFKRAMSTQEKDAPPTFWFDPESNVTTIGWMDARWAYALSGVEDREKAEALVLRVRRSYGSVG
jgi:anti-sigma factor RsiW